MFDFTRIKKEFLLVVVSSAISLGSWSLQAQSPPVAFKVKAFYTGKNDQAHISFVHEANPWFARMAAQNNFIYDSTTNWNDLNDKVLAQCKVES